MVVCGYNILFCCLTTCWLLYCLLALGCCLLGVLLISVGVVCG